jgi:hypothetical protein
LIPIIDILEKAITQDISTTLFISKVVQFQNGYSLRTCDTFFLKVGDEISYMGKSFVLSGVNMNESVFITTNVILQEPYAKTAITRPMYFEKGTLYDATTERSGKDMVTKNKLPFFWVRLPFESINNYDDFSPIAATPSLELYLLDATKVVGDGNGIGKLWDTEKHYDNAIKPMENYWDMRVIPYIKKNKNIFGELTNGTVRGLVSVGVESNEGYTSTLFDEVLSGIQVRIDIPFKRTACKC